MSEVEHNLAALLREGATPSPAEVADLARIGQFVSKLVARLTTGISELGGRVQIGARTELSPLSRLEESSPILSAATSDRWLSTLGVGSFGTAYLVQCLSNNSLAVIKQIDIAQMSEEERRETLNEAKILEVLNHPNITRFREVYKTKKGKLCIVMDYADDGDLQGKIKQRFKTTDRQGRKDYFTEDELLNWFTQIALALKHCHDKKILHRDLKS